MFPKNILGKKEKKECAEHPQDAVFLDECPKSIMGLFITGDSHRKPTPSSWRKLYPQNGQATNQQF